MGTRGVHAGRRGGAPWRRALGAFTVTALAASGYVAAGVVVAHPAGAVSQTGGDDLSAWSPNWSWTYNRVFHYQDPNDTNVTIDESVKYANAGVTTFDGQQAYDLSLTGSITGGSGTACDGGTGPSCSGGTAISLTFSSGQVTGDEYLRVSDLALLEDSENQSASGEADGLVGFTANIDTVETPSPQTRLEDFRLHNGDSWTFDTTETTTGSLSYSAGSFGSGTDPIDGTTTFDGPATDTAVTKSEPIASNLSLDEVSVTSTDGTSSDNEYWSPTYDNLAEQDVSSNSDGTIETLDRTLTATSIPTPAKAVTETLNPNLTCAGGQVTVAGALSTGQSGQAVSITLDESQATPGQAETASTTTGTNGAYSTTITAPALSDGLAKAGIQGSWGVIVTTGGGMQVATMEVLSQDCDSLTYTGTTTTPQGSSAPVSALLIDTATAGPVVGATVTFSISGQSNTVNAVTGSNGEATANLAVAGPPRTATVTASFAGNGSEEAATTTAAVTVTMDPTQTVVTSSEPSATVGDTVTFTATVSPTGASVSAVPTGTVQFKVDGSPLGSAVAINNSGSATSIGTNTLSIGTHSVVAVYSGDSNYAGSTSPTFTQVVHKVLTQTSTGVTSSVNPTVFGESTTFTGTVTAADGGSPTGSVAFFDGNTEIGSGTLAVSGGSDKTSLPIDSLAVGDHTITAVYESDANYGQSTSPPIDQTVQQASSSVTLTPSDSAPVSGEDVSIGIEVDAVAPGSGAPTGTVQLTLDGNAFGSAATLSGGVASVDLGGLAAGSHTIAAAYSGDTNFGASNTQITLVVSKAHTMTVLMTNPDPSVSGQPVTMTATVTPVAPGAGAPTGLVTFLDGSNVIGSATLSVSGGNDVATIALSNLAVGDHELSADYGGDVNFVSSVSATVDQTVNEAPPVIGTTTAIAQSPASSVYGQAVSYTATVTPASGSAAPTGTVQFSVDGTNLGSAVTLGSDGTATSQSISTLTAGGHTVIAAYSGAVGFSVSGAVQSVEVGQAPTSVALTSSANPAAFGTALTFTATLSSVAPGAGTPVGSVQFTVDGKALGSPVTVVSGKAKSAAITPADPGAHTVTALSSGSANFAPASASLSQQVGTIPTTTTLIASPNPSVYGQTITMTATVTALAGTGTPTGTITFLDGATTIGTAALATVGGQQQAQINISTLAAGTHPITAKYPANARFSASENVPPLNVVVKKAPTSIAVTAALIETQVTIVKGNVHLLLVLAAPPSATLTTNGAPLANQPLVFTAGSTALCTATTNSKGVAQCPKFTVANLAAIVANYGYHVTYAGNANYQASSNDGGLIHVLVYS